MFLPRHFKRFLKIFLGYEPWIRVQVNISKKWMGNNYGGFYINPEKLDQESIIYSIGIGEDVSFDKDLIDLVNCSVYAYDPTPKSIEWVSGQSLPPNFHFFPLGIGVIDGQTEFYLPRNKSHVSGSISVNQNVNPEDKISVQVLRLSSMMKSNGHDNISVLKIDIEGAEYEVVNDILSSEINIDQILIEFHHRHVPEGMGKTKALIKNLKAKGYKVFGISESGHEISFIK